VAHRPSLPKLLALEKDFSDLDEQLDNAARIIGLPQRWHQGNPLKELGRVKDVAFNPRAEWVLRWLLDKLKATDETGRQSRSNIQAWALLDNAILLTPVSNAARLLTSAGFLAIVERTLEESLRDSDGVQYGALVENTYQYSDEDGNGASRPLPTKKGKRKRTEIAGDLGQESKRQKEDFAEVMRLLVAVSEALRSIILKSEPGINGSRDISCVRMRSVLKTDSEAAARLLSLWIKATEISFRIVHNLSEKSDKAQMVQVVVPFHLILEVWEKRKLAGAVETVHQAFSKECLTNAVSFLSYLYELEESSVDLTNSRYSDIIFELEKLLASHIFIPTRDHPAVSELEAEPAITLAKFLEPVSVRISSLIDNAGSGVNQKQLAAYFNAIPLLFRIAIASTPRETPRKRVAASAWLESVMKTLAAIMLCPIPSNDANAPLQGISKLEGLLQMAKKYELSISSEALEQIIGDYSGLLGEHFHDVRWPLVLLAIELDRDLFLPRTRHEKRDEVDHPRSLHMVIFARISEVLLNDSLPSQSSIAQMRSIARKLMQNYNHGRNLEGFLRRWHSEISKFRRSDTNRDVRTKLLWEEPDLLPLELRSILESSLTQTQLSTIVQEYSMDIKLLLAESEDSEAALEISHKLSDDGGLGVGLLSKLHASLVMLDAVLGAISARDIIDCLRAVLLSLQQDLTQVLSREKTVASMEPAAWRILSRLFSFLWPYNAKHLSSLERMNTLNSPAISNARSLVMRNLSLDNPKHNDELSCEVGSRAFAYILNVCDNLAAYRELEASLRSYVDEVMSALVINYKVPSESDIMHDERTSSIPASDPNDFLYALTQVLLVFPHIIE
jgi:nucleolar pre-ribosomal-associated protein 2